MPFFSRMRIGPLIFVSEKGIAALIPLIHKVRTIVDRSAKISEENYKHAQNGIT